ncbi:MAG: hypothetical protein KKH98_07065, partial [Spirochaetes bacterium]|nr:hypothetical protein [Spirochaetota bacterium]
MDKKERKLQSFFALKSRDTSTTECPDEDTIYDFFTGSLKGAQRGKVIRHINQCPTCMEALALLAGTPDEAPEGTEVPEELSQRAKAILPSKAPKPFILRLIDRGFEIIASVPGIRVQIVPAPAYRDSSIKEEMAVFELSEKKVRIRGELLHGKKKCVILNLDVFKSGTPFNDVPVTLYRLSKGKESILESQNTNS